MQKSEPITDFVRWSEVLYYDIIYHWNAVYTYYDYTTDKNKTAMSSKPQYDISAASINPCTLIFMNNKLKKNLIWTEHPI